MARKRGKVKQEGEEKEEWTNSRIFMSLWLDAG